MLFRVRIGFNSENRTKYRNTFYGHKAEFLILKKFLKKFKELRMKMLSPLSYIMF
jgi:hypothetical protein